MNVEEMRRRAAHALADIHPPIDDGSGGEWEQHHLQRGTFPVPEQILFALRNLCDLESWGPAEKLRWGITARFGDLPFSIALEKFGLRLYVPKGTSNDTRTKLCNRLRKAASLAETCLRDLAQQQIESGNVTIKNEYHYFDGAYRFFREKAAPTYVRPSPAPVVLGRDKNGHPRGWSCEPFKFRIEGGYLAGAMLDAYFSRLEHILVIVLPFIDFDPSAGALLRFVGSSWNEKWREVFDLKGDHSARTIYDQLRNIRETVRNPLSHGGFGKNGTSFFFHVEQIGALPALFPKDGRPSEPFYTRVSHRTYDGLCKQLDNADAFLAGSKLRSGVLYAKAGLDVALSADFRAGCKRASQSPKDLEDFMDRQYVLDAMHANMDY